MIFMEMKLTFTNFALGVVMGYISFALNQPILSAFVSLTGMAVVNFSMKKILKIQEERNWWFGNAVAVFIFSWFVVWTIFYNLSL